MDQIKLGDWPTEINHVATEMFVDKSFSIIGQLLPKPIITKGQKKGSLVGGSFEWSWGSGAKKHVFGYPFLPEGKTARPGITYKSTCSTKTFAIFNYGFKELGTFLKTKWYKISKTCF